MELAKTTKIKSNDANTRTFYQTSVAAQGSTADDSKIIPTLASGVGATAALLELAKLSTGATWVTCVAIDETNKCNGGVTYTNAYTGSSTTAAAVE